MNKSNKITAIIFTAVDIFWNNKMTTNNEATIIAILGYTYRESLVVLIKFAIIVFNFDCCWSCVALLLTAAFDNNGFAAALLFSLKFKAFRYSYCGVITSDEFIAPPPAAAAAVAVAAAVVVPVALPIERFGIFILFSILVLLLLLSAIGCARCLNDNCCGNDPDDDCDDNATGISVIVSVDDIFFAYE